LLYDIAFLIGLEKSFRNTTALPCLFCVKSRQFGHENGVKL
jgi:hypothetical protein